MLVFDEDLLLDCRLASSGGQLSDVGFFWLDLLSCNEQRIDIVSRQPDSGYEDKFMHRALDLARLAATLDEVPVGAVVVKQGRIIGEGYNQSITNGDPTAHAEIVAMRNACVVMGNYRLTDCDLYVTVEPCTMCVGAMVHARIKRIFFGTPEPRAGALQSHLQLLQQSPYNHSIEFQGGLLADECSALMSNFFRSKRKKSKSPIAP